MEGEHHEEKVDEKRKINNFTPELAMTPSKEKSTNRESEGDDERFWDDSSKEKSTNNKVKGTVSQLRVEGDRHEEKVKVNRKINKFTPEIGTTPSKEKLTNSESEGDDERVWVIYHKKG
ncbi:hypothetical protein Tco_0865157 [Tanacetum coccineum]